MHEALAEDVLKAYQGLSLTTRLKPKSGSSFVKFIDIAVMVNDAAIDMGIQIIAESVKYRVALSSLMVWLNPLKHWLSETPFVILPLHLSRIHRGLIIVKVAFPTTLRVNLYEPLHQQCYRKEIKSAWRITETGAMERFPRKIIKKWNNEPAQPDGTSCGHMILGMVYAFVCNAHRFKRHRISDAYIRVMRLRQTWLILYTTKRAQPSQEDLAEMQKTDTEISKALTP
ncbi:hypothetical protein JG688_00013948 [Phytophthora aleatoria]|uniref:Ubiquitin-like protease family profile domain-containing protein n=1 Tax=Phytophthora aleatoria TaxID=2496075 RepID=A0A8J5LXV8_9STRA|nr:hypothetical protein JG688_00013948 [Phytophthora aleatoria]